METFNRTYDVDSAFDLERDIFEYLSEQNIDDDHEFEVIIRPIDKDE